MSTETAVHTALSQTQKREFAQKAVDLSLQASAVKTAYPAFVQSVGNSQLFQLNWDQLLLAAPTSLSLLGSCLVAASSEAAAGIKLTVPPKGFKYLSTDSLRASLVETVNISHTAFRTADTEMERIALKSAKLYDTIDDILLDLSGSRQDAEIGLPVHTKQLKSDAESCRNSAAEIKKRFYHWLEYVKELHTITVFTAGTVEEKEKITGNELLAAQTKLSLVDESKRKAEEAVITLKSSLETSEKAFQEAAHNFPSHWDAIAMEFVSGLTRTLLSGATLMINKRTGVTQQSQGQKPTAVRANVLPEGFDDPAYFMVHAAQGPLETLKALLTGGSDGGPDWNEITNPKIPKSALGFVKSMLKFGAEHANENVPADRGGSATQALVSIFKEGLSLVEDVSKIAEDLQQVGSIPPEPKSTQVQIMQDTIMRINNKLNHLAATNGSLQGMGGGNVAMIEPCPAQLESEAPGSVVEQVLSSATTRFTQTQAAFTTSQENYQKATSKLVDITSQLGSIKADLENLQKSNMGLAAIKDVLQKSIEMIIDLIAQIDQLVGFFDSICVLINFVADDQVTPFLDYLGRAVSAQGEASLAGYSFSNLQRQFVYTSTITIRSYYRIFRRIATMYCDISRNHILPGIHLVNKFSNVNQSPAQIATHTQELKVFTDDAFAAVQSKVSTAQAEIQSQMRAQFDEAAKQTKLLPPVPPSVSKAIHEGAEIVTSAARTAIDNYNPIITQSLVMKACYYLRAYMSLLRSDVTVAG